MGEGGTDETRGGGGGLKAATAGPVWGGEEPSSLSFEKDGEGEGGFRTRILFVGLAVVFDVDCGLGDGRGTRAR